MKELTIASGALQVSLLGLGARISHIRFHGYELALSYADDGQHQYAWQQDEFYLGASIGPITNRIAKGQLSVNGATFQLPINHQGHSLHGGGIGFDKKDWALKEHSRNSAIFELDYDLSDVGMTGLLKVQALYTVADDSLSIEYRSVSDTDTYINTTNHVYLNLSGNSTPADNTAIDDHSFELFGLNYVGIDAGSIPNGELIPFTQPLSFTRANQQPFDGMVDHHINAQEHEGVMQLMLRAQSKATGIGLEVHSDSVGYQFYTGQFLSEPFVPFGGFCVETQYAPDAINQTHLYSPLLKAHQLRAQTTVFSFSKSGS